MVRKNWVNLNGEWDLTVTRFGGRNLESHKILVPFPIESQLGGLANRELLLDPNGDISKDTFIYTRQFDRPKGGRILLHFGGVNWSSTVLVNDKPVGTHTGGYDAFTFDITDALTARGPQTLQVLVQNPIDSSFQPRGKQVRRPQGIFYTASTGIWQTVWLEPVPNASISALHIEPNRATGKVRVTVDPAGDANYDRPEDLFRQEGVGKFRLEVIESGKTVASSYVEVTHGNVDSPTRGVQPTMIECTVQNPIDWSPENPHLYDLKVSMFDPKGKLVDSVTSYFGFRDISLIPDARGQPHIALNGKPYFLIGTLDQGFWPDGLYTAPSDEALKYDIEMTKRLGFNMIRKHVKVEPERWYYWCDKLGIIVMQDMPSGDKFIGTRDPDTKRSKESKDNFGAELNAMATTHLNHPSVCVWVLFNEGWGQSDTAEWTHWLKTQYPNQLVDSTTGWSDRGVGDFFDIHSYPGPDMPAADPKRCLFLGEFGGLGLPVPGHIWEEKGWGYESFKTSQELTDKFVALFSKLRELKANGLSGAVYTQTTDVETELNGLMTYDRAILKMDEKRVREAIDSVKSH